MGQPDPIKSKESQNVPNRLIQYIKERDKVGQERYGTSLHTFNGRSALYDALDEALDLSQYLMQEIMEREVLEGKIKWLERELFNAQGGDISEYAIPK